MKRLAAYAVRAVVLGWIPVVAALAVSLVWGADSPLDPSEGPGVHLSVGVIAVVVGIVAFVGPGFYLLGRYDHRLTSNEAALLHVEHQMETMVERSLATGDRIAVAVEALAEGGLSVSCPIAECPYSGRNTR